MIGGEILALALGLSVLAYLAAPLLRRDAAESERISAAVSDVRDLSSKREMLLASLRDLEDDYASGKVDESDYAELRADLSTRAVAIMKQLEALDEAKRKSAPVEVPKAARGSSGSPA